ncbi:AI-2E family transporter [Candidatus Gracilibacteria bacterium]|nr:MAG: AI-2E family transporter [Candidatus Gracilibacteria bacterium]
MFERKEKNAKNNIIVNFSLIFFLIGASFYILYIGQSLIIPFIISILFSFAILGLTRFYEKMKIPSVLAMILSIFTYLFVFYYIGFIISSNINELIKLAPSYQIKLVGIFENLTSYFGIDKNELDISGFLSKINLQNIFNSVFSALTSISSSIGTILFYTIFILLEAKYFSKKIELMIEDKEKRENILEVLNKIEKDVKGYFSIKVFVSFLTAMISYIIMILFGLDFAIFWALLIFVLNFIPNIGSIIAVLFPAFLSFIQPGFGIYTSIFMITLLTTIQMLVGNFIEPKLMGNKLNLSPLIIIISLSFWGYLWGIIGMLLSVPLMVIINIILSKFEQTRPIAIFLSEKGDLQVFGNGEFTDKKKIISDIKKKFKKKNKV